MTVMKYAITQRYYLDCKLIFNWWEWTLNKLYVILVFFIREYKQLYNDCRTSDIFQSYRWLVQFTTFHKSLFNHKIEWSWGHIKKCSINNSTALYYKLLSLLYHLMLIVLWINYHLHITCLDVFISSQNKQFTQVTSISFLSESRLILL